MSDIMHSFIESVRHLPEGVGSPMNVAADAVVVGLALGVQRSIFGHTNEKFAVEFPNPKLAEAVINTDDKTMRRERMAAPYAMTVGLGFLAAQFLGHPTYETTTHDNNARVVVVEDVSLSMQRTSDLAGTTATRGAIVQAGLDNSIFKGNLGLIQSGATAKVTAPLSRDWHSRLVSAEKLQVDPNGGDLVAAINLGASLLPIGKDDKREGSVLVISDGTIDQGATELAANAAILKRQGVRVKVIVPGTGEGKYVLEGSKTQIASGANADKFAAYGADNITEAKNAKAVKAAIKANLTDASERREKRTSDTLGWIGALVLGSGILRSIGKNTTRKV